MTLEEAMNVPTSKMTRAHMALRILKMELSKAGKVMAGLATEIVDLEDEVTRLQGKPLEWLGDVGEVDSMMLNYKPGDDEVHLHCSHTADELRAIATWMEENK